MTTLRHVCSEVIHQDRDGNYHGRFDRECMDDPISACPACEWPLEEGWFRSLYLTEPMNEEMMRKSIGGACSNCWGHEFVVQTIPPGEYEFLDETEDGEEIATPSETTLYRVLCSDCLEETRGTVSNYYVGRARLADRSLYGMVSITLGVEFGFVERRSREENLAALGFGM